MDESTLWWMAAGVAAALELLSGSFYLLMLALGLAAAALSAHLGAALALQFVVAAAVGGGSVLGWHLRRRNPNGTPQAGANRDVLLDIGETVQVNHWNDDGSATVHYRGADWAVLHRGDAVPAGGAHRVVEIVGSRLLLEKI